MNKTIYLTLQNSIRQILAMILFIVLARYLTVEDFGKYQQLLLIVGMFGIVFSMGIPVAISYFHGQTNKYREKVSIYKRFFLTQLLLVFIGIVIFNISSSFLATIFKNNYFEIYAIVLSVIMITTTSVELFRNLATVTNNLKHFMVSTSVVQLVSIIISIAITLYTQNIYYLLIVTAIFNTLIFLVLVKKNLKYFLYDSPKKLINKTESKYVIAMGSVALVQVFNGYIDQIMVSIMLTVEDYSNLKIGAFQIPFIGIITGSLLTVMIPIMSKYYKNKEYENIIDMWKLSMEKASILLVPIVIFCLVFASELIISFFGDKYQSAVIVFQAYMIQWLRAVVIFGGVMGAIGLQNELFKNTILITILNVILNYFLILKFGVIGAAIATTFLNYFGALLLIRKINKRLNSNFFSYFPYKIYFISLFLSIFICGVLYLILDGYLNNIYLIILLAIFFYAIMIILQLKIFYKEVSYKKLRELL
ncbi:oligosaccharide flippase family protein [Arcobacter cloacae]|uniref:Uncharacterized protein n=1 Tax=Arcobacter cloacae TaxID=1054034 RepID=A0A6M8NJE7_9BACT|nr:oligosaccharide flippase family protein [Arcobacter cloacae]QKF90599.1 polysaccharide biosynthesis protein [Arcobacter cloacae]RXI37583.1 hypothetical protein CP963_12265 [Arcobacter cloacae]